MTLVGRRELDHPALGTAGGSGLHASIEAIYTVIGDDLGGRFKAYSGVANSVATNIKHNFGVAFEELNIFVYTGTFPNLTLATNYTVAVDGGNPKTHINVTTPGSGGPHTFAVFIAHGAIEASQIKAKLADASKFLSRDASGNVVAVKDIPTGAVVGTTDTQTLTNKTMQQALVDDFLEFNEESAPTTPASGKVRLYPKADGKFYRKDDTGLEQVVGGGSGAGGINYLLSSGKAWDFEDGLATGWSAYADAAGVAPVDGTGGAPSVTFAASSSSPLRGLYSGLFTKDAANRQGEGASVDFTLDAQDVGKPFTFSIDTSASANFTGVSGTESMRVYCYDVTNAALLPGYVDVAPGSSTTRGFFIASSSTSYRFILHVSGTGTAAWTLKIDNVTVGQQTQLLSNSNTDWIAYTPTTSGIGTISSVSVFYKRDGNSLVVMGRFTTGNVAASEARFGLPSGLTVGNITSGSMIGRWYINDATSSTRKSGPLYADTSTSTYVTFQSDDYTTAVSPFAAGLNGNVVTSNNNTIMSVHFEVPISQWTSNIVVADRAVEQYASNNGTWDASDTTSFVYGILATQTGGALTSDRTKRVRFQTPHNPTSKFRVLFSQDGKAFFSSEEFFHSSSGALIKQYDSSGSSNLSSGVYLQRVSGSDTDVDVIFFRYYNIANDDSPVSNWPSSVYWTVERVDGGAVVGYPVGARNVVGDTTGTVVPSGYIGQRVDASISNVGLTSATDTNAATLSLTVGNWLVFYKCGQALSGVSSYTNGNASISTTSATFHGPSAIRDSSSTSTNDHYLGTVVRSLDLATTTTVYAVTSATFSGGTVTSTGSMSQFFAIRIG